MKKYPLLILIFLLGACTSANRFVSVSMPNFKSEFGTTTQSIDSKISIMLEPINIQQNSNYSTYFENSTLQIRIQEELKLLEQGLKEEINNIVELKGYKIVNSNPHYILKNLIDVHIEEKNVEKLNNFLRGSSIKSNLAIKLQAKINFIDRNNPQNSTNISSNTKIDSLIPLNYPIKSDQGVNMFKSTISKVPTQLNEGLQKAAFEVDRSLLSFYRNTLDTLYKNLPKAKDTQTTTPRNFNNFNTSIIFEDDLLEGDKEFLDPKHEGIIIFE